MNQTVSDDDLQFFTSHPQDPRLAHSVAVCARLLQETEPVREARELK